MGSGNFGPGPAVSVPTPLRCIAIFIVNDRIDGGQTPGSPLTYSRVELLLFRVHEWWGIMIQESPLCYENTRDNESGYNGEDLASSVNTLSKITSSHDQLIHEDGRAFALIKCLIWTYFVSLIVLALWILMYWRQPPDAVDWSTNEGIYQPRLYVCMI